VNKTALHRQIIARLEADLELYFKAARTAHAEATDPQSKAENKYDTRGLEASYLARGQSRQAAETEAALAELRRLPVRDFAPADPIDLGACVGIEPVAAGRGRRGTTVLSRYFLAPKAGGTEVEIEGEEITVITPQSPLGRQLMGRRVEDRVRLELGGPAAEYRIRSVE
jgi:transcription elongation GreA/GreB family factor